MMWPARSARPALRAQQAAALAGRAEFARKPLCVGLEETLFVALP